MHLKTLSSQHGTYWIRRDCSRYIWNQQQQLCLVDCFDVAEFDSKLAVIEKCWNELETRVAKGEHVSVHPEFFSWFVSVQADVIRSSNIILEGVIICCQALDLWITPSRGCMILVIVDHLQAVYMPCGCSSPGWLELLFTNGIAATFLISIHGPTPSDLSSLSN